MRLALLSCWWAGDGRDRTVCLGADLETPLVGDFNSHLCVDFALRNDLLRGLGANQQHNPHTSLLESIKSHYVANVQSARREGRAESIADVAQRIERSTAN